MSTALWWIRRDLRLSDNQALAAALAAADQVVPIFVLDPALSIIYLGAASTLGAYGLYSYGVSKIPASQASAFVNLIPLFTLLFAVLVLGETLNGEQIGAALVVFTGVALSQWQKPAEAAVSGVLD